MKKNLIFALIILTGVLIYTPLAAQNNEPDLSHYKVLYQKAIKYNDMATAKNALYHMIAKEPENDSLLYTLAYLYFDSKQYASSILVNMDIVKRNPDNLGSLEMMAIAYETLGLKDKALENYEKLYLKNNDINSLYKMAFLQYDLKRYDECKTNTDILLQNKEIDDQKLIFSFEKNKQKEFAMRVSVLNLKGMVNKELGNEEVARKSFEEALAIAPDFVLAKENLDEMNK